MNKNLAEVIKMWIGIGPVWTVKLWLTVLTINVVSNCWDLSFLPTNLLT